MYKLIESYDANGDLSKEWFVKYHFLIPDQLRKPGQSEWQRFKITQSINCYHTKTERRKRLIIVKKGIRQLLAGGFNPFEEFRLCDAVTYSQYNIITCIDKYLDDITIGLKTSTLRKYRTNLSLFKIWLSENNYGHYMIYHSNKELVYNFVKHYQNINKWSNKTYNHYLNSIHAFYQHYIDNYDNYIDKNPCNKLKRLQPLKKGNRPFDNHEFTTTINHLKVNSPELYDFCRFVYYSCLRPDAECRLLKISDIDLIVYFG